MNDSLTTQALLLERDLRLHLGQRSIRPPGPGECLIRVAWAGVCGSDLHVLATGDWVTYWPATLGHEIVGTVVRCPGGELAEGSHVVVDSRVACGRCAGCARSANLCESLAWVGEAHPGGYQRHAVFAVSALHVCPPELEPEVAVLAEPLAVAMHAVSLLGRRLDAALILGYGPIGALIHLSLTARWPGLRVRVAEPEPARLELARAYGAEVWDGAEAGWPLVVDAAGFAGALPRAIGLAARGGTVLLAALAHAEVTVRPVDVVEHGLTIIGVNGFADDLPAAVARLAADPDRYRPLITEALLLDEASARLATISARPAAGKLVIRL